MKTFRFTFMTKTSQGQEFSNGYKDITAKDYDEANKLFNRMDKPFCTFILVEQLKNKKR